MTTSSMEKEFVSYVVELMQTIGPVRAKRMFGGHGIFHDGLMFALIADNTLYLKTDANNENDYKDKGLEAFTYKKNGKDINMSYYQAPEEALESSDEMNSWATRAYKTAVRCASKK